MTQQVEWACMTAPQLRARAQTADAIAIVPVGALEQHGPHLPVITDSASAYEAAVRAARLVQSEVSVAVLPSLWLGMSEHHLPFGGTISTDFNTFQAMFRSILRSLKSAGFSRVLIVNGHGGNQEPLSVIVRELAVAFDMPVVLAFPWDMATDEVEALLESGQPVRHACEGEASVMLAISPEFVQAENFSLAVESQFHPVPSIQGISRFSSFAEISPVTGTYGDPRLATPQKGEQILAIHARELAKIIKFTQIWSPPDRVWKAGRGLGPTAGGI